MLDLLWSGGIPTMLSIIFKIEYHAVGDSAGGNHYCLMANDVQNSRLVHSFINIKHCI